MNHDALLDVAIAGDPDAFMKLVNAYDAPLRSLAYKITGDPHAMQDVMQDTYLKAYTQLRKFDRRSSFNTWIYRICHNAAIDHTRRTKSNVIELSRDVAAKSSDGNERLDILRALAALPTIHRSVVVLVDEQGFSYEEAAEILGVSPGTVSSRLTNARTSLRRALGAYMEESR